MSCCRAAATGSASLPADIIDSTCGNIGVFDRVGEGSGSGCSRFTSLLLGRLPDRLEGFDDLRHDCPSGDGDLGSSWKNVGRIGDEDDRNSVLSDSRTCDDLDSQDGFLEEPFTPFKT